MKKNDLDQDTWYELRDDRPGRINGIDLELTRNFRIGVEVGNDEANNYEVQVMTCVALNMLARWCRNITMKLPDSKLKLPSNNGSSTLQDHVIQEIEEIDPFGNFQFTKELDPNEFDCILHIGNNSDLLANNTVHINSNGWLAYYSNGLFESKIENHSENNPIGAVFSACLGVGLIYSIALEKDVPKFKQWYSTFDLDHSEDACDLQNPDLNPEFDFGRIHQIGCGAVGSSLIKFLSYTNWKGEMFLIDYDNIEIPNLCSSLAFNAQQAFDEVQKVNCCNDILSTSNFNSYPFDKEQGYDDFILNGLNINHPPDLILCLANEKNIWSTIQENYPPLVFHATTTSNWGTNFGSHNPIDDWCIMCRFHKDLKKDHTPKCSESVVDITDKGIEILGVLPFLSPISAAMVLAGLGRLTVNSDATEFNSINLSFRRAPLNYIIKSNKKPDKNCPVCSFQDPSIYSIATSKSKYWKYQK